MNTNYYSSPTYPAIGETGFQATAINGLLENNNTNLNKNINMQANVLAHEQPYMENLLKFNKGKLATFYLSFPNSENMKDRSFKGIIEVSGKDYVIVSDPKTGKWNLLLTMYINYIEFEEKIVY